MHKIRNQLVGRSSRPSGTIKKSTLMGAFFYLMYAAAQGAILLLAEVSNISYSSHVRP